MPFGSKFTCTAKVKFFQKQVKLCGTNRKVLSQGIHMYYMNALSPSVKKLLPRLHFSKSRSKVTVRVTDKNFWYQQ